MEYRHDIESGRMQLVTRNGENVEILTYEAKGTHPIIARIGDKEDLQRYDENGSYMTGAEGCYDLFVIFDEPEPLTEFERHVDQIVNPAVIGELGGVREIAGLLLEVARRQFVTKAEKAYKKEGLSIEDAVIYNEGFRTAKELYGKDVQFSERSYWNGYEEGLADAAKIDIEKLTDRIVEKVVERFVPKESPGISPFMPVTPVKFPDDAVLMYGCPTTPFQTTDSVAIQGSADTTNKED